VSRVNDAPDALDPALAAARQGAAPVEVDGSGSLATHLRERLGLADRPAGERPATVVETTGELARVESLMHRVDDLGTVILAGPPVEGDATVDFYVDVHVRGLTVITVAPDPDENG
jgi:hypothetical protein